MITAEFNDFSEMVEFAKCLIGGLDRPQNTYAVATPMLTEQTVQKTITQPVSMTAQVPTQAAQAPAAAPVSVPTAVPASYAQDPAVPVVQTASVSYTLDDLARAAMTLMDSGRQSSLQDLLKSFGVEALPALPPTQYGAFATALRGMGAQI